MAQQIVLPFLYLPNPETGRPLFSAKVYLGEVDQDPQLFPIQAYHYTEAGAQVPIAQPLLTGAGGVIMVSGSPASIVVEEEGYSMRVLDNQDNEIYTLMDVTGSGAIDPDLFVLKAGDTMTGQLNWVDEQGDLRMQTIDDVGFNGLRVFDLDGAIPVLQVFTDGSSSYFLAQDDGLIGFLDAQQTQGQYRFIVQSAGATDRKMVLGTPWPIDPATFGYDHLQLYFERDAATSTPFFVAETAGITQAWIGPDGEFVCTGADEIRNFEDDGSGGWGLYATDGAGVGLDTILVMTPAVNVLEGGAGNEVYYAGEIYFDVNETSDSPGTVSRFKMKADGSLLVPSLIGTGTRDVQVQADGTLIAV